jgi:hypothetical protein
LLEEEVKVSQQLQTQPLSSTPQPSTTQEEERPKAKIRFKPIDDEPTDERTKRSLPKWMSRNITTEVTTTRKPKVLEM